MSLRVQFSKTSAELYIPDGAAEAEALGRTTHLAVAAHHDDIEIMAYHGIAQCFDSDDQWFSGVVVTNGAGSPRTGRYAALTEEQMLLTRRREQKKAAIVGEYAAVALLDYPSAEVRDASNPGSSTDLRALMCAMRPQVVYTHNLADKHDAHVAVALRTIGVLRALPVQMRPARLLGCEVWRDLDWLCDDEKVALDAHAHENLATALLALYDSQIDGGKRYDLAAMSRRRAHATYLSPLETDATTQLCLAADLTPLMNDATCDVREFLSAQIERFRQDALARLTRLIEP